MFKTLAKLFGGSDERVIKKMRPLVDEINDLEPQFERLTDDALRAKTDAFRREISNGASLDDVLPDAYAAVREAARRALGQRHYDVQMIGGIVLHQGKIAEMKTGEGKTLVATLPAYLNSLAGDGVHVVTVNDYLARRDANWMGAVYARLGVSVGALQNQSALLYDADYQDGERGSERMRPADRREAYQADITYGTNNEFGFDYLRDNMASESPSRVQRSLAYAIVDEVDNILIDEARTPLIISGPGANSARDYARYARVAPSLKAETDYTIDEKHRTASLTQDGISKLERTLNLSNLYGPENFETVHQIENALRASVIYQKDRDYVVQDREVVIVDEFTGRLMTGRRYSDGLHQAIEAKEGVRVRAESVTYATITLQNYFRLYDKLSGMTGTASTEAEEFDKIYKLDVVSIPTNRPMARVDSGDLVYRDQSAKYRAVVSEIERRHRKGQPVLVGTTDIDKSEILSGMLNRKGIRHEVLNAKQHEREAVIVAQAGKPGAVTVATNMAGRGTDIVLGGSPDAPGVSEKDWQADHDKVIGLGGLYIIGTERHEARRIDNQLRGRAGRQGDPGATQFYTALDDDLMRRFGGDKIRSVMDWAGADDDVPIDNGMINKTIENAQVKVEGHHFDLRKHLVEYDDVVNTQRGVIYGERDKIISGADLKANIQDMLAEHLSDVVRSTLGDERPADWDVDALNGAIGAIIPPPPQFANEDAVRSREVDEIESELLEHAESVYGDFETLISDATMRDLERFLLLRSIDTNWVQHLTNMENLRQGIGLQAFGQRDPLVMYRREGMEQFQVLEQKIQSDVARSIFRVPADSGLLQVNGNGANGGAPRATAGRGNGAPIAAPNGANVINGASRNRRAAPQARGRARQSRQPVGAAASRGSQRAPARSAKRTQNRQKPALPVRQRQKVQALLRRVGRHDQLRNRRVL